MGRVVEGACRWLLAAAIATALPGPSPRAAQSTQYTYDALGRVLSAIDANGKKVVYSYDSAGNRTRVSNGAEFQEIVPTAWSASSNAGTTGLSATNGMKDGGFDALASIHATQSTANAWVMADLGATKNVNHIDVAPAINSAVGALPEDLNGTVVEYSVDGSTWVAAATINGVAPAAARSVALGGISARYVRIRRSVAGQVALGDLRLFSSAAANSPLIAEPDSITSSGSPETFNPRLNDVDLDGYAFTISAVEDPPHGTAVINGGATITYTPDPSYFGADSFLYTVADGHNGTASARVTVLVRPSTNHAPVAVDDSLTVSDRVTALVDGINALRPAGNDYDADGDVITITAKTDPTNGTVTIVGGNLIEYRPNVSSTGSDSFTYTISDGRGGTDVATVNLTLANSPPVAGADQFSVRRGGAITFDPRLNDHDPNGDVITVTSPGSPTKGAVTLNPDQTLTYTANTASGADSFSYTLTDARGGTAAGQVNVVTSPNSAPQPRGDSVNATTGVAITFDPRVNDTDAENDPLTVTELTAPGHGAVTIASGGGSITYTMAGGYSGFDTFSYTVSDDEGATATAVVAVNGVSAEYFVLGGGGSGFAYSGSGGGGGGGGLRQGTLALSTSFNANVTVGAGGIPTGPTYSGGASAFGDITATGGGLGGGGNGGSGGGAAPGNSPGVGTAGQGSNGGASSSGVAGGGGGGAAAPGGAGTPGQAGAGGAGLNSDFSGAMANYAAGGGAGANIDSEGAYSVSPGAAGGASGGAGASIGTAGGSAPANRGGGGGGASRYYPDNTGPAGYGGSGIVMLRYAGSPKGTGGTITQAGGYTLHTFTTAGTLGVTSANTMPVAVADTVAVTANAPRVFDPTANDTDANGDPLVVMSVGTAGHGAVTLNAVGAPVTYTPAPGFTGTDSFSYVVSDGAASATALVNVTVAAGASVEYLVVAGGGGGGRENNSRGGGGGGGGVRTGTLGLPPGSYDVTIGIGGAGANASTNAANGANSGFAGILTIGGGAGGQGGTGFPGGSGGGASKGSGGAGTPGQGYAGGSVPVGVSSGGGGGGASAPGQGVGGAGFSSALGGSVDVYGSGGGTGGANGIASAGAGGTNAGNGSTSGHGGAGVANRGGGGGGGGYNSSAGNGGAGGSGVVIIRYPTGAFAGSGGTVTSAGGYTIHTFTSSGTFVVP